ncbi:helix-turn-helix domain-containing protein [Longimicrobium terrae]|uniref:Transcriptional regulator with XRE-family HTH domain n=1 Tax=Longimicrobium terrae TaxID=1639882 RepID=A0A841GYG0_9BACT|nr:helix-turn-helix transcriptional regulator [Longimicrobium terrae]MBB4636661.1 transcriptional regulator with XRE-family HTH domain [Longimicrobium terrae]MBB6070815.1 transcriptional regulator with XRE-family HTH domain [Longimicrobium terrae]NNC28841.1 helix-turn-helix transcriptional regulator [Longimicrobium terrae]
MLPVELRTPNEITRLVAARVRELRLNRGWTQQELADRAGVTLATYRRFERTGRIAFDRLLKIAVVLDARSGFDQLFTLPPARSLAELAARSEPMTRQRGRRRLAEP